MSNSITTKTSPANIDLAIERINKLNTKAAKKGFDNVIEFTVGEIELVSYKENGVTFWNEVQEITISRRQPLINGWKFVGKVDYTLGLDKGIVKGDENIPAKFRTSCHCDHCNTTRTRNTMYVLQNESGDYINVGSTCIQDFLEIQVDAYMSAYFAEIDCDNMGGSAPFLYDIVQLIAAGKLIADNFGYVSGKSAREKDIPSTADLVLTYLSFGDLYKSLGMFNQTHIDYANTVINHFNNKDANGNAYLINLKTMLEAQSVRVSHVATVVSAIGSYMRDMDMLANRVQYTKGFLGAVKDKIVVDVTIETIKPIDSYYGVAYLIKMRADSNHCLVWLASNKPEFNEGEHLKIKATIKNQKVYQDIDQTCITRAKAI